VASAPPPARSRKLAQFERAAEARFDFMGLAVIGPASGPVRFLLSKDPRERLRVSNANCVLESMMQWERYASSAAAERLWEAVEQSCLRHDLIVAGKRDWFQMPPADMAAVVERAAQRLAVLMITPEDKARAIADMAQEMMERALARASWPVTLKRVPWAPAAAGAARGSRKVPTPPPRGGSRGGPSREPAGSLLR
jgi:leucyl aminopeptidase (aminopeptidase T)